MGSQRSILAGIVVVAVVAAVIYGAPKAFNLYRTSCKGLPAKTRPAVERNNGKIAYVTMAESPTKIIVMDADGSNRHALLAATQSSESPAWSPDGKQIAFTRWDFAYRNIFIANADGSSVHAITNAQDVSEPAWSPDGLKIAFTQVKQHRTDLYVMDSDGQNATSLMSDDAVDRHPVWSPDGKEIAFSSTRDGSYEIYVMNSNGSNVRQLTDTTNPTPGLNTDNDAPSWSPDGKYIAFTSRRNGKSDIYLMNADGSNQCALAAGKEAETAPTWSPDGQYVLFRADWELYRVALDGSDSHVLTQGAYAAPLDIPSWGIVK